MILPIISGFVLLHPVALTSTIPTSLLSINSLTKVATGSGSRFDVNRPKSLWESQPLFVSIQPLEPHLGLDSAKQTETSVAKATVSKQLKLRPEDVLCDLNSSQTELSKLLRGLSVQTGADVILLSNDANDDPKLSVRLERKPFVDVLRHLAAITNKSWLKVNGTFVVGTGDRLKAAYPAEWTALHPEPAKAQDPAPAAQVVAPAVTKIYQSNYVDSSQLADVLTKMFPDKSLTVLAGPASASPSLSTQSTSQTTGVNQGVITKDPSTEKTFGKMLILRGPADVVAAAIETAKSIDTARPQVSILVSIYDISDDAVNDLGLSWTFGDLNLIETNNNSFKFGTFGRAPLSFNAKISALATRDRAKLLSSPNIVVMDNEKAFVLIGSRLSFPVVVGYTQANTPIFDKQEERVGVYLQVAPSISSDNQITLSLYPQVSTVTGFIQVNGGSYPQISTREAQTTLRVGSGETIVLAGLLQNQELSTMEQVPILSKIPILGELFNHRKKTKSSSQVIISITPIIVKI